MMSEHTKKRLVSITVSKETWTLRSILGSGPLDVKVRMGEAGRVLPPGAGQRGPAGPAVHLRFGGPPGAPSPARQAPPWPGHRGPRRAVPTASWR